jgi:hypothetical protein
MFLIFKLNKLSINLFVALAILLIISHACNEEVSNKKEIRKELANFKGTKIIIPDNLVGRNYGNQILDSVLLCRPHKMIVFINQDGCTGCKMQELVPLYIFILQTTQFTSLGVVIILNSSDIIATEKLIFQKRFRYSVFYDLDGSFERLNPHLPKNERFHTFLLGENDEVLLVGNPALNIGLKKIYLNTLNKLQQRDW